MHFLRCSILGLSACLIVASNNKARSQQDLSILNELKDKITAHFAALPNSPIPLYGSNYYIADAWDGTMARLLYSAKNCFKSTPIRSTEYAIPSLYSNAEASLGFMLRLKRIFDLGASASRAQAVEVAFQDVTESVISEFDLKKSFNRKDCSELRPLIDGANLEGNAPVVIGRLYEGKRRISITYANNLDASARIKELFSLVPALGLNADVSVISGRVIVVTDKSPVDLAFLPAFVPMRRSTLGGGGNDSPLEFTWTSFDLQRYPSQVQALKELTTGVNRAWKWNEPE